MHGPLKRKEFYSFCQTMHQLSAVDRNWRKKEFDVDFPFL
jgi:hypothetical protein